jgi:hypothetical protein
MKAISASIICLAGAMGFAASAILMTQQSYVRNYGEFGAIASSLLLIIGFVTWFFIVKSKT